MLIMEYGYKHKACKTEYCTHCIIIGKTCEVYELNKVMAVSHYHMTFLHTHKGYEKTNTGCNRVFNIMGNGLSYSMLKAEECKYEKYDTAYKYCRQGLLIGISHFTAYGICNKCGNGKAWTLRKGKACS